MAKCWEKRACDDEMRSRCAHQDPSDKCPTKCAFAVCYLPTHVPTTDAALIFDPTVDRRAAIKEICTYCEFFLTRGPRMSEE